ncbi:sugar transferase [Sphingomonas sp. DBB INV C78]|uniref:sugar transferase n=1 Tax=Sphingomonas sp. DBB INV C78 TaxID=3349434 RepID=UPI0036D2EFA6
MSSSSKVPQGMSFLNDFTADDPDRGLRVLAEPAAPARPESELLGRALDISVAALILLAVLPVFLILCLAIWAHDGGAPIFMHRRIGRGGKMFPCLKLRTMVVDSEQRLQDLLKSDPAAAFEWHVSQKLRNDPRITPLGAFLRKSSLDELPQLINVLFGQMSLVGPRPIVMAEATRYGRYFKFYCAVRPGITGLWQVSGRNDVSYRRRVALDTLYARSRSVAMDLAILTRTVPAVLSARGCS